MYMLYILTSSCFSDGVIVAISAVAKLALPLGTYIVAYTRMCW